MDLVRNATTSLHTAFCCVLHGTSLQTDALRTPVQRTQWVAPKRHPGARHWQRKFPFDRDSIEIHVHQAESSSRDEFIMRPFEDPEEVRWEFVAAQRLALPWHLKSDYIPRLHRRILTYLFWQEKLAVRFFFDVTTQVYRRFRAQDSHRFFPLWSRSSLIAALYKHGR